MNWASIFAAIISIVGPLVQEWLKRWLDDKLKAVEATLPAAADREHAARVALEAVLASTWFFQTGKRRFVRSLLVPVPKAVAGKAMSEYHEATIADAARGA